MSNYIGAEPSYGVFDRQILTGDGSTTQFTLDFIVAQPSSLLVSIDGVIQEDPNLMAFVEDYVLEHKILSRKRFTKSLKLKQKGREKLEDWGLLDDAEKENLFDLIAEEFPDL